MCGRFSQTCSTEDLELLLDDMELDLSELEPDFNIGPGREIVTITGAKDRPRCVKTTWGIPLQDKGGLNINARSETVESNAFFCGLFAQGRCVVPVDGFYEWESQSRTKNPWYFSLNEGMLLLAGLFRVENNQVFSTVLTTQANQTVGQIHHRMPVIIEPDNLKVWLMSGTEEDCRNLLVPLPDERMRCWPVSRKMNDVRFKGPECCQPLQEAVPQQMKFAW